jgi:hypothetical protein
LYQVKHVAWDEVKNERLRIDCGIVFEEIVFHIARGGLLDILNTSIRSNITIGGSSSSGGMST